MLKSSLLFKKNKTSRVNNWRILRIRMGNFKGTAFTWTRTYSKIFKSTLMYLYKIIYLSKFTSSRWFLYITWKRTDNISFIPIDFTRRILTMFLMRLAISYLLLVCLQNILITIIYNKTIISSRSIKYCKRIFEI